MRAVEVAQQGRLSIKAPLDLSIGHQVPVNELEGHGAVRLALDGGVDGARGPAAQLRAEHEAIVDQVSRSELSRPSRGLVALTCPAARITDDSVVDALVCALR